MGSLLVYKYWRHQLVLNYGRNCFIGIARNGLKVYKVLLFILFIYRHLSLSQLVVLCIIQVPDSVERAKTLKKWIELSQLLQSGTYANLFAFMSIMKGLESPQVEQK